MRTCAYHWQTNEVGTLTGGQRLRPNTLKYEVVHPPNTPSKAHLGGIHHRGANPEPSSRKQKGYH